jgi:hypothetical protein
MKRIRILLTLILLFGGTVVAQTQIKDFNELMKALKTGKEVKAVFHYNQCQLISDNEISKDSINAIGGMPVSTWEYFARMAVYNKKAFLVASESRLISNPKADNGFVHNYVKMKVYEDDSVKITAKYINPKTYEETMSENFFGEINNGRNKGGIYLYKL